MPCFFVGLKYAESEICTFALCYQVVFDMTQCLRPTLVPRSFVIEASSARDLGTILTAPQALAFFLSYPC